MKQLILEEIERRPITRLCHFTNSRSFLHIVQSEKGIIANNFLGDEEEIGILSKNDNLRLDGKEDYISCSIEYPNTWYLDKVKNKNPNFKDWVILFIDPTVMVDERTLFCHRNAAAERGKYLKSGIEGLTGMFAPIVQGMYPIVRSKEMLSCSPTDGQAEVMVYKNIPRDKIIGVCVRDEKQLEIEKIRLEHLSLPDKVTDFKWIVSSELFSKGWMNSIKMGQRPREFI